MTEGHFTHRYCDLRRLANSFGAKLDRTAEVECYYLAAVVAELHRLAVEVKPFDLGRRAADRKVPEFMQVDPGCIPVGHRAPGQEEIAGRLGERIRKRDVGEFLGYSLVQGCGLLFQGPR